jgi:hypothetical protein
MNDKPINYQSQISKSSNEIIIDVTPDWWKSSKNYFYVLGILTFLGFQYTVFSDFEAPSFVIYLLLIVGLPTILLGLFMHSLYLNRLTISRTEIVANTERKKNLRNIPFIDFEVEILENKVKVSMQGFQFSLKDMRDLPKLTEEVAELLDLDFYSNYQLRNNKEVLTYKAKRVTSPNFSSFLTFKNVRDKLQIHDITSQYTYFRIEKKLPITEIIYSIPDLEERDGIESKIKRVDIQKIVVETDQNAGILGKQHRIIVKAYVNTKRNPIELLRTKLRNSQDELTNWRDGERVYDLLKAVPKLNIPIEQKVIK